MLLLLLAPCRAGEDLPEPACGGGEDETRVVLPADLISDCGERPRGLLHILHIAPEDVVLRGEIAAGEESSGEDDALTCDIAGCCVLVF